MMLNVTEIQRFCMHDGPGVRTTVFFKGCPLRCAWCHNPETQNRGAELLFYSKKCVGCGICEEICSRGAHSFDGEHFLDRAKCASCFACASNCPTGALEKCGKQMSVEAVLSVVKKDSAFYGEDGGITVSGGEPFLQKEAVIELLSVCKELGISTAVETCGVAEADVLLAAVSVVDLFLWDIKDTDPERHRRYTGASNRVILENLRMIDKIGARTRLRCILVNGVNTDVLHYENLANLALSLSNCDGIEIIPYHAYGGTKATFLGCEDNGNTDWIPSEAQIAEAKDLLRRRGATVI